MRMIKLVVRSIRGRTLDAAVAPQGDAATRGVREVLLQHARGATSRHATREELARKRQRHRSLPSRPSAIIGGKSRCDIPKILVTSSGDTSDVIWQGREWR